MWIDRIISDSPEGPQVTDLHERLTVISSADPAKRRSAFDRIVRALHVAPGSTLEVRTGYGETVSAHRTTEGTALFDTRSKLPIDSQDRSLGIVGWLNNPQQMQAHIGLFHVNAEQLQARAEQDAELIHLAQTPLDQLFALADHITTAEAALADVRVQRTDLSESKRERETREQTLHAELDARREEQKRGQFLTFGALGIAVIGVIAALLVSLPIGLGLVVVAAAIALIAKFLARREADDGANAEALEIQLGRVDELFDTQNLTRNRRTAEEELAQSWEKWRSIAGDAQPSVLIKDRRRIEELASHLQLISHGPVAPLGDKSVLVGLASLLSELTRRFASERVPLLIDDPFQAVISQHHPILRELLLRASHRRQVVLETEDIEATKWAAVEAVGGQAFVLTDYDINADRIIEEAVSTDATPNV